ncbi:MAG: Tfp pilus assembly protein FimT/FimU [Cuspidothrix sp.]
MPTGYKIRHLTVKLLQCHGKQHIHPNSGFSLLEVIAVMAIIGILSGIIFPSWLAFVDRQRLNKVGDEVLSAIRRAQTQAQNTKNNYSVSFRVNSSDIPEYIVYQGYPTTTNPSSGWTTLGNDLGLKSRQVFLYTNLTSLISPTAYNTRDSNDIVTTTTGSGTITFNDLGVLANKTGTVADTPLKVMLSIPQTTSSEASDIRYCVIIQTLIGAMQTAKDTNCQ